MKTTLEVKKKIDHIDWCDRWINFYHDKMVSNLNDYDNVMKCKSKIKELAKSQDQAVCELEAAGIDWISFMHANQD